MTTLTYAQVYALAKGAGLGHEAAVTATAIATAESGLRTDAMGDTTITTGTWGPSIGLWQIRSVKAEKGTGRSRDASRLKDPRFNARSMVSISGNGTNWRPWSVYLNGSYRSHINAVRAAVGGGSRGPDAPLPSPGQPITAQPVKGGDGLFPYVPDLGDAWNWGSGQVEGVTDDVAAAIQAAIIVSAALALGVGLVVIGARRLVA